MEWWLIRRWVHVLDDRWPCRTERPHQGCTPSHCEGYRSSCRRYARAFPSNWIEGSWFCRRRFLSLRICYGKIQMNQTRSRIWTGWSDDLLLLLGHGDWSPTAHSSRGTHTQREIVYEAVLDAGIVELSLLKLLLDGNRRKNQSHFLGSSARTDWGNGCATDGFVAWYCCYLVISICVASESPCQRLRRHCGRRQGEGLEALSSISSYPLARSLWSYSEERNQMEKIR